MFSILNDDKLTDCDYLALAHLTTPSFSSISSALFSRFHSTSSLADILSPSGDMSIFLSSLVALVRSHPPLGLTIPHGLPLDSFSTTACVASTLDGGCGTTISFPLLSTVVLLSVSSSSSSLYNCRKVASPSTGGEIRFGSVPPMPWAFPSSSPMARMGPLDPLHGLKLVPSLSPFDLW